MSLSAGDKLGPYEIVAPIGAAGMGDVYKARDTRLDRIVALKVSDAQFSERFEREAKAIAALNHPNICTLHDVGPELPGHGIHRGHAAQGPLPVDQALKYAAQICDALDAVHKKGITHRDLKPANILVTKAGIKLLDVGLAKLASTGIGQAPKPDDATLTMALTGKNEIVGTLYYMSPELDRLRREADAKNAHADALEAETADLQKSESRRTTPKTHSELKVAGAGHRPGKRNPQRHLFVWAWPSTWSWPFNSKGKLLSLRFLPEPALSSTHMSILRQRRNPQFATF